MARTVLGLLAGMLACLLATELLLRLLPVSTATMAGYHVNPQIYSYAPNQQVRYAIGWDLRNPQWAVTNGHGFVSDHAFTPDPTAVALIGDSFAEAASLVAADRPAAQLERALQNGHKVYAMGTPGSSLLDYAERIRWAHQTFGVRRAVILLEATDPQQTLCNSGNVTSMCLDPVTLAVQPFALPAGSGLKRVLRHSALAQYMVSQLKLDPARLLQQLLTRSVPHDAASSDAGAASARATAPAIGAAVPVVDAATAAFFERVRPIALDQLILVVDTDRRALGKAAPVDNSARSRFIALARAAGATVIDTEPLYRRHFASSSLSLEIGPYDGHFNRLAVELLMQAVARELAPASMDFKP